VNEDDDDNDDNDDGDDDERIDCPCIVLVYTQSVYIYYFMVYITLFSRADSYYYEP